MCRQSVSTELFFETSQISNEICRYIRTAKSTKSHELKEFKRESLSEELPRQNGRSSEDIDLVFEVPSGRQASDSPTRMQDYEEAALMLRQRMAKAAQLNRSGEPNRVLVDQLLDLVIEDYRSKRRQTTYDVEHRVAKHLRPFFGTKRPFEITLSRLDEYVASRAGKAAPATVNKELPYLRRAFASGTGMSHNWLRRFLLSAGCRLAKSGISRHDGRMLEQSQFAGFVGR